LRIIHRWGSTSLLAGVLLSHATSALAKTTPGSNSPGAAVPGTPQGGSFSGSVPEKLVPGVLPLSLQEAIDRGLKQNLGLLLSNTDIRSARGQRWEQLSALLPHATLSPYVAASKINLAN
jgi:outer membrane protein TolC